MSSLLDTLEGDRRYKLHLSRCNKAKTFFKHIGLPFKVEPSYVPDPEGSFFKGCWIDQGVLHFVPKRVDLGELLHEAGHLALTPKALWPELQPGSLPDKVAHPFGDFQYIADAAVEAWDWAAAHAADIPSLCVFIDGFNGKGLQVWESFDQEHHPGFALLRALGMSTEYGTVTRWFIGNACISTTKQEVRRILKLCSQKERKSILKMLNLLLEEGNKNEQT